MKTARKWLILGILVVATIFLMTGCTATNVVSIPAGYVGKILTPTGWQGKWIEAGQVDLGKREDTGFYNQLVLLEATSVTFLEQFGPVGSYPDGQDHRILTQDGVPIEVNVTVRMCIPEEEDIRDTILAQITPKPVSGQKDVSSISVQDIYLKFSQAEVRSTIRALFAVYQSYEAVYADYANISTELGRRIGVVFTDGKVPLRVTQVSLSNVKPDSTLWSAKNQQAAATSQVDTITNIGETIEAYPRYIEYMKWEYLLKIAQTGQNTVIVVGDQGSGLANDMAAVQHMLQEMQKPNNNPPNEER